jgi:sulfate permease, SulP family
MLSHISEILPELNLPGVRELRQAVTNRIWRKLPRRTSLRADAIAGLNAAINNVPDGMADSILIGVNPLYGLYANLIGPLLGGAFSSTQIMMITTTLRLRSQRDKHLRQCQLGRAQAHSRY